MYVEGERREVVAIAARWREPDGDYFRVRADDGHTYVLHNCREDDSWELAVTHRADS